MAIFVETRQRIADMGRFLDFSCLRKMLPELALASVIINLLALALPLSLLQIYDRIIPHQSSSTLGLLMGGVIVAVLVEACVRVGRSYITGWIGAAFEHRLGTALFRRLLEAPISQYEREGATVHLERMRSATLVRDFYSGQAILALFDVPFIFIYLGLIALLGGWLVVAPALQLTCFVVAATVNTRGLKAFVDKRTQFEERRFSFIAQTLSGIHSIKTMAMEAMMVRRYELLQSTNVQQTFDGSKLSISALNIGALFSQLSTVVVVAVGAVFAVDGHLTPGALAACITLTGRCLAPINGVLGTWVRFQNLMTAHDQINKVLDLEPAPSVGAPPLPGIVGALRLENISFTFPGAKTPIFKHLNLELAAGECIAIQGDSGCGKSTLLGLMAGMIPPSEGRVLADDYDLGKFSPSSLPLQLGYLPQLGTLFEGTIMDNITMRVPQMEEQATLVARALGLESIIATMRNGFATEVGGNAGDSVPGGVRQRIAIARALLYDPSIILFDEANNALDSLGDEQLRSFLAANKGKRTMVLVTHRPSLVKLADRILEFHDGGLRPAAAPTWQAGPPQVTGGASTADAQSADQPSFDRPLHPDERYPGLIKPSRSVSDLALCLPKLLTALNWQGSPRQFAESLPHMAEVMDLDGLRKVMASLGYTFSGSKGRFSALDFRRMPYLFLPDDGDALLLLEREKNGSIRAFDGGRNKEVTLRPNDQKGVAYHFRPADSGAGLDRNWTVAVLDRFRPLLLLTFALTIFINILALAGPGFVIMVFDLVIPSGDLRLIPMLLIGLSMVLGVDWVVRGLRARVLSYMGARGEFLIGTSIFQRILSLPAYATEQVPVGSQIARIKDFESLRDLFVGPLAVLFYELPATLVFVVVLGLINPWLILVQLCAVAIYWVLYIVTKPEVAHRTIISAQAGSKRQEFMTDALSKMRGVKFAGAEELWHEEYRRLSGKALERELDSQHYFGIVGTMAQTLGMLTALATITTAVICTFNGVAQVSSVVASMIITWRLVAPMQNGFMSLASLARVSRSVKQIDGLMRINAEREPTISKMAPPKFRGEMSFVRASFRYNTDSDPVLLGVSFHIEPGQVAAIAGPNGAGKSTILKLMTGIYQPQAGSVRLDSSDIRQVDPVVLRSSISYAPQRCEVFYGTIAQNLRLSHPTATDEEMRWAAEMAGLYDDIMAMSDGFNTRVQDGQGDQLPHGFRQRLSLARAYLKPASLLLFDEPGNGLDAAGDQAFLQAIERLRKKHTICFVSHRPSHLRAADVVVYMEEGYVRQVGTFNEVSNLVFGTGR